MGTIDDFSTPEGETVQFYASATDPEQDPITCSATGLPAGVSINSSTGEISGTINYEAGSDYFGTYQVTVYATDSGQNVGSEGFEWTICNVPLIGSIDERTSLMGATIAFQIPYITPHGETPTFAATGLPDGLSIDEDSGLITGTLEEIDSFEVTIELDTGHGVDERSFTWNVISAPSVTAPQAQVVSEGVEVEFSETNENAIVVADSGPSETSLTITLTAQNGTMTLAQTTGLSFSIGDGTDDETMTFSGEAADINAALDGLGYTLTEDTGGFDLIAITVVETNFVGPEPVSASIIISPGGPTVEVPDAQAVDLGDPLVFSVANENAIVVGDSGPSDTELTVTITVMHGTLTLAQTTGLTFTDGDGTADETMTFTGEAADINDALDGLEYELTANVDGLDTLRITVDDPLSLEENAPQAVGAVDIASGPAVSVPGAQALQPGEPPVFSRIHGNSIAVGDSQGNATELTVTLSVDDGTLTLSGTTGLTFDTGDGTGDATMTFTGEVDDINAALNGLVYETGGGFDVADTLTITVDNATTLLEEENQASASVDIVEGPTPTVPDAQTTAVNTALEISVSEDNAITVEASGPSNTELTVTLTASNGLLTLAQTTGLTFDQGDGEDDETMTFTGEAEDINDALDGLTFTPTTDYEGPARLNVSVSEALGTPDIDVVSGTAIDILVGEADTVPGVDAPYMQATDPETTLVFSSGNDNAIVVSDTGPSNTTLTVSLAVENGILTLAQTSGLTFTSGGDESSSMTFTGTAANINAALDGLTYTPSTSFEGTDTLRITVDDPDTIANEAGQAIHAIGIVVEADVEPGMLFLTVALDDIETESVTINVDLAEVCETIAEADELMRALQGADGTELAILIQNYYQANGGTEAAFDEEVYDAMTAMVIDFLEGTLEEAGASSWQFAISEVDEAMEDYCLSLRPPVNDNNFVVLQNQAPAQQPLLAELKALYEVANDPGRIAQAAAGNPAAIGQLAISRAVLTANRDVIEQHLNELIEKATPAESTVPWWLTGLVNAQIALLADPMFRVRSPAEKALLTLIKTYQNQYPVVTLLQTALRTTTDGQTMQILTKILKYDWVLKGAADNLGNSWLWELDAIKQFSTRSRALSILGAIADSPGFTSSVRSAAFTKWMQVMVFGQ